MSRAILHVDMNSFYASVETQRRPELRGLPVAVCGDVDARHGIILTANYFAKPFGVKTGMPIWQALQRCPKLQLVPADMDEYIRISGLARKIYEDYTDQVESFGLDEAWLDVTASKGIFGSELQIAIAISRRIKFELGITASIGVSFNKITAKLGSDYKKPDAITYIPRENYKEIVYPLPVQDLLYVGAATKAKLNDKGIYTIGALAETDTKVLTERFGKIGLVLSSFARGEDASPVQRCGYEREIKSVGNSCTSPRDLIDNSDVWIMLLILSESVSARMRELGLKGRVVKIDIRDRILQSFSRQCTINGYTYAGIEIAKAAFDLFLKSYRWEQPVRSLAVCVTKLELNTAPLQTSLIVNEQKRREIERLEAAVDELRSRYGYMSVQRAVVHTDKLLGKINPKDDHTVHPYSFFY